MDRRSLSYFWNSDRHVAEKGKEPCVTLAIIFFLIFFGFAVYFIATPVIRHEGLDIDIELDNVPDVRKSLQSRRSELMLTLRELDFDLEMGKLSKEDYQLLRKKFELETVETLRKIDQENMQWDQFRTEVENKLKNS